MRKLTVSDCTLLKMCESGRVSLLFREKTALSSAVEAYGADILELPRMKKQREDAVIFKSIASLCRRCAVAVTVTSPEEMRTVYPCVAAAKKPVLQIELPVSTVQMEYTYHLKNDKMLLRIAELVKEASAMCPYVTFIAQDASRAEPGFLKQACAAACENGASAVMLCDTAGILSPEETAGTVREIRESVSCAVIADVSDSMHMAAASAYAAIEAGADGVRCSAFGDDGLKTGHLADLLAVKGESLGIVTGLDMTRIHRDIMTLLPEKTAEISKTPEEESTASIFLDAESTLADVAAAARQLGYDLEGEDLGKVHAALRSIADKKGTLGARELEALIAGYAMQVPSTYHLVGFNVNCSNITSSMAHVILSRENETFSGVSTGDGPIDAAFRAIEQIVGFRHELDDFQIQAVTEGKEALGQALVRLRSNGRLYSGSGLSTDIVGSSIRAYVNALNKIVAGEQA